MLIFSITMFSLIVYGEEAPGLCAPDYDGTRRATLEFEGELGVWLAAPVARCVLRRLEAYPLLIQRVGLLEERLGIRDEQIERVRRIARLSAEAEERAVEALELSEVRRAEALERLDAWHRSPGLWLAIGIVGTTIVVVAVAWALGSIS